MRVIRDIFAVLLLGTILAGGIVYFRWVRQREAVVQQAASDVRRLELEIKYRAATKQTELNTRGWPVDIDPKWFEGRAPDNPLLTADHPWLEIAGPDQEQLQHPPVRVALDGKAAAFWYNPSQGIVRARVPVMVSDRDSTDLYNRINGTALPSILWKEPPQLSQAEASHAKKIVVEPPPQPLVVVKRDGVPVTPQESADDHHAQK